jgi:hypothetical protein
MFLLYRLSPGAPIWPIGVGGPRSEPIVVTPLLCTYVRGGGGGKGIFVTRD